MARTRKSIVNEADKVFSLYIRNRGSTYDYNHCFTCGVYLPVEELQCGHFRPRRYMNTRFHPFNCWPQCNECNVDKGGNSKRYEEKLIAQFGQDAVDGIYQLAYSQDQITEEDLRAIIKEYKV